MQCNLQSGLNLHQSHFRTRLWPLPYGTENSQPCLEIVYEIDLTEVKSFLTHAIDIEKVKVNMLTNSTGRIVADIVNDLKVMADKIYVD